VTLGGPYGAFSWVWGDGGAASGSLMSLASLDFFNERVDLEKVNGGQWTPL